MDDKCHTLWHARTRVRVGTEACDTFLCRCLVLAVLLNVKIRWDAMAATSHFSDLGQFDQDLWIPQAPYDLRLFVTQTLLYVLLGCNWNKLNIMLNLISHEMNS